MSSGSQCACNPCQEFSDGQLLSMATGRQECSKHCSIYKQEGELSVKTKLLCSRCEMSSTKPGCDLHEMMCLSCFEPILAFVDINCNFHGNLAAGTN